MATVYLHIGAPKTATSNLQAILAGSQKVLRAQGVLYPEQCRHGDAHHVLVADLIDKYQSTRMPDLWYGDFPRGEAWSRLASELASAGPDIHTAIVSTELFFGQSINIDRMLGDIRAALSGHAVKVIMYLRRQDQLYASFYNQDVKGARQWAGTAYEFYETHQIFQRDYDQIADLWGRAFGAENLIVRPYEPEQWLNGDIVADFCHSTGISALPAAPLAANESLGASQLYIKRCLNHVGYEKADNDAVLGLLQRLCPEPPLKTVRYVNRGCYNRLRKRWEATNQRLAGIYGNNGQFFRQAIPAAAHVEAPETDEDRLLGFVRAVRKAGRGRRLGSFRSLFARASLLVIAEQNLWAVVPRDERIVLEDWALDSPRARPVAVKA